MVYQTLLVFVDWARALRARVEMVVRVVGRCILGADGLAGYELMGPTWFEGFFR